MQDTINRITKETNVAITLSFKDKDINVDTGIGFFDHMLQSFGTHGGFGLSVQVSGDLHVDGHHTVEDCGIVLGQAFREAVGDKKGIARFGDCSIAMDDALVQCILDFSGRPYLAFNGALLKDGYTGGFENCMLVEFLRAFAYNAGVTLHVRVLDGSNPHHIIEATFKALARSLKAAVHKNGDTILSTKGSI